jgi:endonuclease III
MQHAHHWLILHGRYTCLARRPLCERCIIADICKWPGKNPREVEDELVARIPAKYMQHAHHWLILHGRYTCLARRPLCERCIIADLCKWPGKTVAA